MKDDQDERLRGICFSQLYVCTKPKREENLMDVENREILFCDFM